MAKQNRMAEIIETKKWNKDFLSKSEERYKVWNESILKKHVYMENKNRHG